MLFSDNFFVTEEENFQILTIKTDQICGKKSSPFSTCQKYRPKKGGETKDFFERSHTFSSFTDHPFS